MEWLWSWVIGRSWRSLEGLARNIDAKGNFGEGSKRVEESWRESFCLFREYVNNCEWNVGVTMDNKGPSGEVLDGNEEHVLEQRRKSDPCYKVTKISAELSSSVCGR